MRKNSIPILVKKEKKEEKNNREWQRKRKSPHEPDPLRSHQDDVDEGKQEMADRRLARRPAQCQLRITHVVDADVYIGVVSCMYGYLPKEQYGKGGAQGFPWVGGRTEISPGKEGLPFLPS